MRTYDYLRAAIENLETVRRNMLDALLESQFGEGNWITSEDFGEINALSVKLEELLKRYAPMQDEDYASLLRQMRAKAEE